MHVTQQRVAFERVQALNASTNVDRVTDFSVVDDTIQLDNAIFAALGGNGTLSANQFVANASGTATNASQHITYETDTGWLYYDSNGNAAGGSVHFRHACRQFGADQRRFRRGVKGSKKATPAEAARSVE
ncbi:hypothetical protein BPNPMPFG_004510 [Mesorhizobium sp. AR07]|uniref:hypothetical protein n=1 Tax=Mesorhizobium sp. AR07 TaxID=2865838 RepID=UPI0022077A8D|nr:hypothetical protein [Mesorhizobium sp. AR07]UVK42792.1 hypothetical protein BPNPMPFG_004510 [Mesorhizobium sp. AR07]